MFHLNPTTMQLLNNILIGVVALLIACTFFASFAMDYLFGTTDFVLLLVGAIVVLSIVMVGLLKWSDELAIKRHLADQHKGES